jgi:acetolactate synthase-1/2/3 large subunit
VGVPFGIAAALAFPDRQVAVLSGDGSFGFNAIELDTCRRHGARVVFIVANNGAWNIERNDQKFNYGGRIVGTELEDCNYAKLARSLGVHGQRVEHPDELPEALAQAFNRAPALLDVKVTREAVSPDSKSGLATVPDTQALTAWDELEKALGQSGEA